MISIRGAAMGERDEPKKNNYTNHNDTYWPPAGEYEFPDTRDIDTQPYSQAPFWTPPKKETINYKTFTIVMSILPKDIGKTADAYSKEYDEYAAEEIATTITYDKIEALLGKQFDSKYKISFRAINYYEYYEVEATLTPINE